VSRVVGSLSTTVPSSNRTEKGGRPSIDEVITLGVPILYDWMDYQIAIQFPGSPLDSKPLQSS